MDWDKLLSGSNLPAWSKKCLVIVERFGTEAQIDYLKKRRDQIILEVSEIAVDIIETILDDCADAFRSKDIPCSYRGSRFQSRSALPVKPFPVFSAASPNPEPMRSGKPAALEQDSFSVLREAFELSNEALCECAIPPVKNSYSWMLSNAL